MKKYLLLQFRTDQTLEHEVSCVKKALDLSDSEIEVVNVFDQDKEPTLPSIESLANYKALITGASGQYNVTDLPGWAEERIQKIISYFKWVIENDFPTLAICFGHQIIAKSLGGEVKREQAENGNAEINLTEDGKLSPIFKDIPEKSWVVSAHKEAVTKLPNEAKLLAYSEKTKIESYQIGKNVFAVQFHPELELDDLMFRLSLYPEYLQGKSIEEVRRGYHETPFATKVLKNFKNHVEKL